MREARREILQHCIYAVDLNPLAVELVKISLWLRACVKDKPLNFLDNHIKCGNSLIGVGKEFNFDNIPNEAFIAIKGNKQTGIPDENIKLQNMARKQIKKEEELKTSSLLPYIQEEKAISSPKNNASYLHSCLIFKVNSFSFCGGKDLNPLSASTVPLTFISERRTI